MNGEPTKDEEAQAYAQTGHSELVERLRVWACAADEGDRIAAQYALGKDADPALTSAMGDDLREAAAALTAQAEEIARLTRERDEAQAKERERCAKIADKFARDGRDMGNYVAASWAMDVAAAIRGETE